MTKPWRTVSVLAAGLLALLMVLSAVAGASGKGSSMSRASNYWNGRGYGFPQAVSRQSACAMRRTPRTASIWLPVPPASPCGYPVFRPLPPRSLQIDQLELEIRSYPPAGDSEPPATDLEQYERWAAWLPQRLTIADLRISLPCAKGRCDERGR